MNDSNKVILLVEDNPDDAALTLRAFKRSHLMNPIAVARDGIEALDFLFARGAHGGRASEDDARLAMRMLRRGGFEPSYRRVQDPDGLKAAIREERWDAVLSDFRLPGFSGVQALEIFRESGLDIPFIFVSGTIGEETAVEAMKAGANDYVMKENLARLAPALERELGQAVIRAKHRQAQEDLEVSRDRYVDLYDFAPVG